MPKILPASIFTFTSIVALFCSICNAQLYETPESRRQQIEAEKKAQQQRQEDAKQSAKLSLEQKEVEAKGYIGKTFWYLPNKLARDRIRFYDKVPVSSVSLDPNFIFTPLTVTSFVVTGAIMPPPRVFPVGQDQYLLEIQFLDGKVGYVNIVGCCGVAENLYKGEMRMDKEYVSIEPATEVLAKQAALREQVAREEQLAKEKAEREERALLANIEKERAKEQAERRRRAAMPSPRIGMTMKQVVGGTNWGGARRCSSNDNRARHPGTMGLQ
jgi:fused signal recognition particle receptor